MYTRVLSLCCSCFNPSMFSLPFSGKLVLLLIVVFQIQIKISKSKQWINLKNWSLWIDWLSYPSIWLELQKYAQNMPKICPTNMLKNEAIHMTRILNIKGIIYWGNFTIVGEIFKVFFHVVHNFDFHKILVTFRRSFSFISHFLVVNCQFYMAFWP